MDKQSFSWEIEDRVRFYSPIVIGLMAEKCFIYGWIVNISAIPLPYMWGPWKKAGKMFAVKPVIKNFVSSFPVKRNNI